MNNIRYSYLLWLLWFFGFSGLHRIYNKKFFTGFLWFCTWGLFGLGQVFDLLLIPSMVDEHNLKIQKKLGLSGQNIPLNTLNAQATQTFLPTKNQLQFERNKTLSEQEKMVELTRAAQKRNGKLSVTQAVIDTGITFEEVEQIFNKMTRKGYVMVDNDPENGVVVYDFLELS